MATPDLPHLIEELNDAVDKNRKAAVKLDSTITAGNKILKRKTMFIIITLCSVILDIFLTVWLATSAVRLANLQDAGDNRTDQIETLQVNLRTNVCNMDLVWNKLLQLGGGPKNDVHKQFINEISPSTRLALNCPDDFIK
jgi:hypothetical protein